MIEAGDRLRNVETITGIATSPLYRLPAKLIGRIIGVIQICIARQQQRHELAQMSRRDFGDIFVPPGLIDDEARRWPWQSASEGWGALRADRRERWRNARS